MHVLFVDLAASQTVVRWITQQEVREIQATACLCGAARDDAIECKLSVGLERAISVRTRPGPGGAERQRVRAFCPVEILRELRRVNVESAGVARVEYTCLEHILTGNRARGVHERFHAEHAQRRYTISVVTDGVGVLVRKTGR